MVRLSPGVWCSSNLANYRVWCVTVTIAIAIAIAERMKQTPDRRGGGGVGRGVN